MGGLSTPLMPLWLPNPLGDASLGDIIIDDSIGCLDVYGGVLETIDDRLVKLTVIENRRAVGAACVTVVGFAMASFNPTTLSGVSLRGSEGVARFCAAGVAGTLEGGWVDLESRLATV